MLAHLTTQLQTLLPPSLQDPTTYLILWQCFSLILLFFGLRLIINILIRLIPKTSFISFTLAKNHSLLPYPIALCLLLTYIQHAGIPIASKQKALLIPMAYFVCASLIFVLAHSIIDDLFLYLKDTALGKEKNKQYIYFLPFLKKISKILITLLGIIILPRFCITYDITGLLSKVSLSIGLVTTAVAFALKDTIHNLIGGITIIIGKLLHAGDHIKIDGVEGIVLHMDLRTTILKTADGAKIHVPNAAFITKKLTNHGRIIKKSISMNIKSDSLTPTHIDSFLKGFNDLLEQYPEAIKNKCKAHFDYTKAHLDNITFDLAFKPISEKQSTLYTCQIVSQLKKLASETNIVLHT